MLDPFGLYRHPLDADLAGAELAHLAQLALEKRRGWGLGPSVSGVSGSPIAKQQLAEAEREDQGSARSGENAFRDLGVGFCAPLNLTPGPPF